MATPSEIDRQVKFEREAIRLGIDKLHKNTRDLENKEYASASVYGCASINALLPDLIKQIEETRGRISKGAAGKGFKEIHAYLEPIDVQAAAAIALKLTFDKVFGTNELYRKNHQLSVEEEEEKKDNWQDQFEQVFGNHQLSEIKIWAMD